MGHSLGGLLSLLVACRRPELVGGLVMLDSPVVIGWRAHSVRMFKASGLMQRFSPGRVSRARRYEWPTRQAALAHFAAKPTFITIGLSDGKDASLAPIDTVFEGNQIACPKYTLIEALCDLGGITWKANTVAVKDLGIPATAGIELGEPKIAKLKPIARSEVGATW